MEELLKPDTEQNLALFYGPAIEKYAESLNFTAAAQAQGISRAALVLARAEDADLDAMFREVENATLDGIESGVLDRAADNPGEARFVLRSKRPDQWGGNDKGPSGPSNINIQVNLFPDE